MKRLILLATLVALSVSFDLHSLAAMEWNVYKLEFGKEYSSVAEEHAHMSAFLDSKQDIAEHNLKYHKGEVSYTLGINEFSDMLPDYKNPRLGLKVPKDHKRKGYQYLPLGDHIKVPNSIDWRTMGAVTPVKDQGQCGSCWAFSATGSLEGQHFRKSGDLVSLSEQQLIDCIIDDYGCDKGGMPDDAFQYVKTNGGVDTEISYPYLAENGICHFMNSSIGATDFGFVDVGDNEPEISQATSTVGPISVGIFANTHSFMRYKTGIYDDANCNGDIDHGVLIVGYGTEEGKDYWIVKNSWGPGWGEDGYIRIVRGKNMCNINSAASYPLV